MAHNFYKNMKTRFQYYRHSISQECSGPDTAIMVLQTVGKKAVHKCCYCLGTMIPASYYSIHDSETKEMEYFILDQKITKDEYAVFESEDRKIYKFLEEMTMLDIKNEAKKRRTKKRAKNS